MERELQFLMLWRVAFVAEQAVDPSRFPISSRALYRLSQHSLDLLTKKREFLFALFFLNSLTLMHTHGTIGLQAENTGGNLSRWAKEGNLR